MSCSSAHPIEFFAGLIAQVVKIDALRGIHRLAGNAPILEVPVALVGDDECSERLLEGGLVIRCHGDISHANSPLPISNESFRWT